MGTLRPTLQTSISRFYTKTADHGRAGRAADPSGSRPFLLDPPPNHRCHGPDWHSPALSLHASPVYAKETSAREDAGAALSHACPDAPRQPPADLQICL